MIRLNRRYLGGLMFAARFPSTDVARGHMVRCTCLGLVLILLSTVSFAQPAKGRTTRATVIREHPRGDSVGIMTIPEGTEVDLLERRGEWYRIALGRDGKEVEGWLNRIALQPLGSRAQESAAQSEAPTSAPPARRDRRGWRSVHRSHGRDRAVRRVQRAAHDQSHSPSGSRGGY